MSNVTQLSVEILSTVKLVRQTELAMLLGISNTTLWRLRQDQNFPKPVAIRARMIGWRLSDIENWLNANKLDAAA
ncbi:AlpA family phage regulatory protein [Vibrio vulnificus]|uniref:helix-turn-helix transcriptional regulator n=1 Tax=Vibrio vulnificus TaxID=672 RepID=UPI000C9E8AE5|nr:AlpA family phage regulatory protein [Vibrio vulnificus]EHZ2901700.1 AlpA family phage regulatory protein [Vibrio vulnificus]EIA1336684.1 AlpA family phage regulatory protein [Vibrio vulnificus]EIU7594672.1 AlpA family phage regulatory protein [Vibrio vulnificus]EIX4869578.1 AlpA family phage regulatory protein [Vibrio vulnificus]EJE8687512.1 AlpA family phage regulatory protein [Vibrio vulnificus]